jgi:ABC-type glycerol-3-phosphate transport system permease component
MAAYPLAKSKAPFMGFLFGLVTVALMFTPVVSDIANYVTMSSLNWIDSYTALIVPAMATSLGLFLMRQFMLQIPDDLIHAAHIDGAGEYAILFRIIMPNVKPAWLTLAIFAFQSLWNLGSTPYIYREELKTMPYALSQIVTGGLVRAGAGAAVSVVIMTVPIFFFIFSQSQIMETMTASGIKE